MDTFYCHDNVRDSKEQQWISTRCEYEIRAEVECPLSRAELLMWRQQHLLFFPFFPIFFFFFVPFSSSRFRTRSFSSPASLQSRSLTGARISYTRRWIPAKRVLYFPLSPLHRAFCLHPHMRKQNSINISVANTKTFLIVRKSMYRLVLQNLKKRIKLELEKDVLILF